jgi:hypothetical protein
MQGAWCTQPTTKIKRLLATAIALAACGFGPLAAVGATLGWISRGRLRRTQGHARGLGWANLAIALGVINSVLWTGAWMWLTRESHGASARVDDSSLPLATQSMASMPSFRDYPELETLPAALEDEDVEAKRTTWTRRIGEVMLTDVGDGVSYLSTTFEEQASLAAKASRQAVVWLVVPDCAPCEGISGALTDPIMQRALSHVLLIRLNVQQFATELQQLRIPTSQLPGFVLLSESGVPVDFVHGGEWDEDIPENIAPVLESFVQRRAFKRRFPWRGGPRSDETPI